MMKKKEFTEKKLLVVVAHPDDETFGMGGTLAKYGNLGVEIHVVCATKGEAGEVPVEMLDEHSSIAELRERELNCAADILNIKKVHFLNYRDSGMPGSEDNEHVKAFINVPIETAAKRIALIIREIRPDVVITFDPIGGYMHPDHIATHNATVEAFKLAGDRGYKTAGLNPFHSKKLYFHIFPRGLYRLIVKLMPLFGVDPEKFGNNKDINLKAIMDKRFPTHAKINYRKYTSQREQASACYASQGGDRRSGYIITWIMRFFASNEHYMRSFPPFESKKVERDLFADT